MNQTSFYEPCLNIYKFETVIHKLIDHDNSALVDPYVKKTQLSIRPVSYYRSDVCNDHYSAVPTTIKQYWAFLSVD